MDKNDPLKLARDIRKRLHLIDEGMSVPTGSVRLDMEACVEAIEKMGAALEFYAKMDGTRMSTQAVNDVLEDCGEKARAALR